MKATYRFDAQQLDNIPLTLEFTADFAEWKKIDQALSEAAVKDESRAIVPLLHCITNLITVLQKSTGRYGTHGYSYSADLIDEGGES